jgi:signal transduction histidine kinase
MIKLLIEVVSDASALSGRDRDLRFEVDRHSFDALGAMEIPLDRGLVEQAIGNLLDNAAKYSFPDTLVKVVGGMTKTAFTISVINRGLQMRAEDLSRSLERGWRSEEARLTTGEGSGIGLWLVNHIMRAHHGQIEVIPTDDNHDTRVRLMFPKRPSKAELI